MPGDFVKQLQLAKQLEQKAREAARARETAEGKIAEATALLTKVKEMSASSAETEKLLTLAGQSYSDKDYKEALSYATRSVEASVRARKERLREMLREARSFLERVSPLGAADEETERALRKADGSIDAGDLDEAYALTKEAWSAAERSANRVLSDAFGRVQSSLLFAEGLDLKVDKQKNALRACREALESGDVGRSVELIQSLSGALRAITLERFVERAAKLEALFKLESSFPIDLHEAREQVARGRELISQAKVEEAFGALDGAEEAFSRSFSRVAGGIIEGLRGRAEALSRWRKVDLGDLEGEVRRLELKERYGEAVSLLDRARALLREAEKTVLLERLAPIQPRLRLAHMTRKDVSQALRMMEESRQALLSDDLHKAMRLADEAAAEVEARLEGYDQVEAELKAAQALRARCQDLGLSCEEGGRQMAAAKRLVTKGDFAGAVDALRAAQHAFRLSLENRFATDIMRLEMKLATAMRLGADVSKESSALEELTGKVRRGEFDLVHGSLVTIGEVVEERIRNVVSEELERAGSVLSRYANLPGMEKARAALAEANERFAKGEYQAAYELASKMLSDLLSQRRECLDRSLREGRELLEMSKRLGVESVTLRDRLQRAEELRSSNRLDEASLLADEVCSYGRSIVSAEMERMLTDLMYRTANARRDGVEVGEAEHFNEEVSSALQHGDVANAFERLGKARDALEKAVSEHRALTESVTETEEMLAEGRGNGVEVPQASEALMTARMHLRSGRYREAREELERAEAAIRRSAPQFLLDRCLRRIRDLGELRERLGGKESAAAIEEVRRLGSARLEEAMASLAQLRQRWEAEVSAGLERELNGCQREVDKAASAGFPVGPAQQILARGRAALQERRFLEAMKAVELVRAELDQTVQADRRLTDTLAQLDDSLEQLREMKADVSEVTVLLEQARALRRTGSLSAAADAAQKAMERSQGIARQRVGALMNFAGGLTEERMSWEDLRTARKLAEDVEEALRNRRYRHAHLLARSFREELERVLQDKAQAEEELRKFESRLSEEAKMGLSPPAAHKALERGKVLLSQGRFVQCMATISAARDELRAVSEMYESRLAEYNELREALNSLEMLDPRKDHIEELLDQCWSSLRELRFESASLYLRRARNALNEFLTVRTNELLWEFNPLHDLIKRMRLQRRFSTEIAEIERAVVDSITPRDLNRLARNVELVKAGMRDVFQEQREKVRRTIEKASRSGKETGRSWEVWADAESQAKKGDLWEAFNSLETAVNVIGRRAGETPEQLSRLILDTLERANRHRIELPGTQRAYAEALQAQKEGGNPLEPLKKAVEVSRKEVRATYPDISAELELVGEAREGRPMDVIVHLRNEAEHEARDVRAFIFGDAEVKGMVEAEALRPNEEVKGRITIIPNRVGVLSLGISVKCKPLLTDEDVLYDSKFDLDVK